MPAHGVQLGFRLVTHTCTAAYIGCCTRCITEPHTTHRHSCVVSQQRCLWAGCCARLCQADETQRCVHTLQATT